MLDHDGRAGLAGFSLRLLRAARLDVEVGHSVLKRCHSFSVCLYAAYGGVTWLQAGMEACLLLRLSSSPHDASASSGATISSSIMKKRPVPHHENRALGW